MNNALDAALLFGFLTFLHLWGGAAIGAGLRPAGTEDLRQSEFAGRRGRAVLAVVWGVLVGIAPMYFGIERGIELESWAGFVWQAGCVLASALVVATGPVRLRSWMLQPGMTAVMIGSLLMSAGAALGALLFWRGAEALSFVLGGAAFLFGAMWFGSGLYRLRGRS
jgi:hypothetical protein